MPHYHINLFRSAKDGRRVAHASGLRCCPAFGETPDETAREMEVAVEAWLGSARAHNERIPESRHAGRTAA